MEALREQIDQAVALGDTPATVDRIKHILSGFIRAGRLVLPERYYQISSDHYARRLLFRNRDLGYTAVVMTWGPGQGTAVHDHAGIWCVEVVVDGEMKVTQYELLEETNGMCRFLKREPVHASVGSAGCLIPPFEHHVLANARDATSITLHIYGGEITRCNVYYPRADGSYERQARALSYDE
ncbi:MAG: cysteine dioxygenase family protein [Acidobacteria bacterium]|nr:cysteine dioxygenase family protein [Acidobacteriota bacterium]MBI3472253.1 cysteine dioxygenase family protein [Candidatus Solibacter usitatus]